MASGDVSPQAVVAFDIGLWLAAQGQGLRGIEGRPANDLSIDQPVQEVQHMGLGCHALGQGQFHCGQHGLFVVLENQGVDVDHLPITAGLAQHLLLQLPEGRRELGKGRAIAQRPGLALKNSQVMPPVIDRPRWQLVAALDDTAMLAEDVALGRHDQPVRIDPQTDRSVRKGRGNACHDCARS